MIYRADEYRLQAEIDFQDCQISQQERTQLQPSLEDLGRAVSEFAESHLWLKIVYHPHSKMFHARAKLKVPGQTIITGERDASLVTAVRKCLQKVRRRVEDYKAHPDREALREAERRAALTNGIIAPVEPDSGAIGQAILDNDYQAFRQALLAHEEPLRRRVSQWVRRYPEVQTEIGRTFELSDLVEEVFLLAFERYASRPIHLSMHEWLETLIDPAIKTFWTHPEEREAASYAQSLVSGTL